MNLPASLFIRSLIGSAIAVVINIVLLMLLRPLVNVPDTFMTLSLLPVALWSVLGTSGATLTFVAVRRYAANPKKTFIRIALVVLVLSFIPDILLLQIQSGPFGGATPAAALVLMLMHVVAAAASVSVILNRPVTRLLSDDQ